MWGLGGKGVVGISPSLGGSMIGNLWIYIYFLCDSAIPKWIFDPKKKQKIFFLIFVPFHNINIIKSLLV